MKLKNILLSIGLILLIYHLSAPGVEKAEEYPSIDLFKNALIAKQSSKVQILYFSASDCTYCISLNDEIINAVRVNDDYQKKILLTEIMLDGEELIIDFESKGIDQTTIASRYNIQVTPTLVFVDEQGKEIVKSIVGYQSNEFYWYYLDKNIKEALSILLRKT